MKTLEQLRRELDDAIESTSCRLKDFEDESAKRLASDLIDIVKLILEIQDHIDRRTSIIEAGLRELRARMDGQDGDEFGLFKDLPFFG